MPSLSKQIFGFYLLLITLGGALAAWVYISGSAISTTAASLVEVDLPLQNNISKLRFAIFAQKPILYEYYANTDRDAFQKRFNDSKDTIKAGLYMIPRNDQGQSFLTQIEFQTAEIARLAGQLDQTLHSNEIDWDKARDILAEVSATESRVTPLIDAFAGMNQKHASDITASAKLRMQNIIGLVGGFVLLMLISALMLGRNVNTILAKK